MTATERLFFGVPLQRDAREELWSESSALLALLPGVRAIPAENWHLTLRFLGDTGPEARDEVIRTLEGRSLSPSFQIALTGWGAFPRPAAARVLWVGVEDAEGRLALLNQIVEDAAHAARFAAESRPYTPHLTVARLRRPTDLESVLTKLPRLAIPSIVDTVTLYRSHLGPRGARYESVRNFPLAE